MRLRDRCPTVPYPRPVFLRSNSCKQAPVRAHTSSQGGKGSTLHCVKGGVSPRMHTNQRGGSAPQCTTRMHTSQGGGGARSAHTSPPQPRTTSLAAPRSRPWSNSSTSLGGRTKEAVRELLSAPADIKVAPMWYGVWTCIRVTNGMGRGEEGGKAEAT